MSVMNVQPIFEHVCGWGEGLCWDPRIQKLYFVDCMRMEVGIVDLQNPDDINFVETPSMPTKILLTLSAEKVLVLLDDGFHEIVDRKCGPAAVIGLPAESSGRFNDAAVDFGGNIISGNLNFVLTMGSAFWVRRSDGNWKLLSPRKTNANGPCFSPDGGLLYIADTHSGNIYRYQYDSDTGHANNETIFANTSQEGGAPDGATIDADGYLWTALYGGSTIVRYTPDGNIDRRIEMPVKNPTDIVFAGPNLDQIIVSSAIDLGNETGAGGTIYELKNHDFSGLEPTIALD